MTAATLEQFEAYSSIPTRIAHAIEGLSEQQKQHRPVEGEWNIHDVVIHLADSETVGFWRLRKTLAERGLCWLSMMKMLANKTLFYRQQDELLALRLFADLRDSSAALLKFIPDEAWELTSIHAEQGKMSVYDYFQIYIEHGENHLRQIECIKQAMYMMAPAIVMARDHQFKQGQPTVAACLAHADHFSA